MQSDDFTRHYIIRYLSARVLAYPLVRHVLDNEANDIEASALKTPFVQLCMRCVHCFKLLTTGNVDDIHECLWWGKLFLPLLLQTIAS